MTSFKMEAFGRARRIPEHMFYAFGKWFNIDAEAHCWAALKTHGVNGDTQPPVIIDCRRWPDLVLHEVKLYLTSAAPPQIFDILYWEVKGNGYYETKDMPQIVAYTQLREIDKRERWFGVLVTPSTYGFKKVEAWRDFVRGCFRDPFQSKTEYLPDDAASFFSSQGLISGSVNCPCYPVVLNDHTFALTLDPDMPSIDETETQFFYYVLIYGLADASLEPFLRRAFTCYLRGDFDSEYEALRLYEDKERVFVKDRDLKLPSDIVVDASSKRHTALAADKRAVEAGDPRLLNSTAVPHVLLKAQKILGGVIERIDHRGDPNA